MSRKPLKFQSEWITKYGLEVSSRDVMTNEVTSAVCLFCRHFGREDEDVERKRKLTLNSKYFVSPWRSDYFNSHLKKQHQTKWKEYEVLSITEKQIFFQRESAEVVNMRSFVQPEGSMRARMTALQKFRFRIDADIIEKLVGDLLLEDDTVDDDGTGSNDALTTLRRNAMKPFTRHDEDGVYVCDVKSALKMNLVVRSVELGISFHQTSRYYKSFKEETGMGVLGSVTDGEVASICRIICVVNLQYLKELFKKVWAFSIALDSGNNASTSYLDLRMRCYFKGSIQNLHVLAIPMRERHTGEYQYDLIVSTLDVLAPNWRYQLIGVSTDGASAMTGCVQGTVSRLNRESCCKIFRIWCGAHQLDLVVKKAFNKLCDDGFISTLTGVTSHLRRQVNLIAEMKCTCPSFVPTRWISMGKVLKWLKLKRVRLLEHFDSKKPSCTPPAEWWIVVLVVQPLVERIEKTFVEIQGQGTLLCEQTRMLAKLMQDLMQRSHVHGPMTTEQRQEFSAKVEENPKHGFMIENYYVEHQQVIDAIDEVGEFVQSKMDALRASNTSHEKDVHEFVISSIGMFSLRIVVGTSKIVAERDAQNSASQELPSVLPVDLCSDNPRVFTASLLQQKERLRKTFSEEEVEKIDEQFRSLRLSFREDSGFKRALEEAHAGHSASQAFEASWRPLGSEYDDLKQFCGGIASVMPGTSSVEADFSLINWTKDPHSQNLTDFSLESILHCKQYRKIQKLFE